jgi:hypothetical protein
VPLKFVVVKRIFVYGSLYTLWQKGEIVESRLMGVRYRKSVSPGFTNDLTGGLSFFPTYRDSKHWIDIFYPEELLKNIDLEALKNVEVKFPHKRDQFVYMMENLKEDDNPVLMIVTLK